MHRRILPAYIFFILTLFTVTVSATRPLVVRAQSIDCVGGSHAATQAEVNSINSGAIKVGQIICNSDSATINSDAGTAKVFLLSIAQGLPGTKAPPDKAHIDRLNNTFAICAANFLKAYSQKYGRITISSAFRCGPASPSSIQCNRSENANAGGATGSNHQIGVAMDVNPGNGDYQTLWKFASQNPQFGVCFPYLSSDRPHMALAGLNTGESRKCAAQGVTKQCSGAPVLDPSSVTGGPAVTSLYDEGGALYGNAGTAPATSPYSSSPYSQSFPGAPAPTFAQTPVTSTATPFTNPLTTSNAPAPFCSPQFSCSNNVMYYQTTSCTTQVYQTCTKGCDGNSCANIASTVGSSTLVTKPVIAASSTTELLDAFANPVTFSASTVATGTSLAVILNGGTSNDIIAIANSASSTAINPGTITSIQPLTSQQTFTSTDLVNTGVTSGVTQSSNSVFKILSDLRSALVWAIDYLKSLSGGK